MKKKLFISTLGGLAILFGMFAFVPKNVESIRAAEESTTYSQGDVVAKDKTRIWIGYDTSNPFYQYADDIKIWTHSTAEGGSEHVYTLSTNGGTFYNTSQSGDNNSTTNFDKADNGTEHKTHRRYDYFDINTSDFTNEWYLTVQKFEGSSWKGQTKKSVIKLSKNNANKVFYVWGDWAWDSTQGTIEAGTIDKVDAGLAAKALAGIHSCSDSNINGYNSFPNFRDTFILNSNSEWKTVGNLSDYTLNDFANGDTELSGSKTNVVNAYDKYVFIENNYNSNQPNAIRGISIDENNTTLIAISVLCVISTLGFFVFIRRKKINLN